MIIAYTACTKMVGAVSSGHNGLEMHVEVCFPHGTKLQLFKCQSHAQSHSPLLLSLSLSWSVTLQKENGKSGGESVLCVAVLKHESVVSLQRAFWRQFQSDSPSVNSVKSWYQQFQTKGCI
jgi:hypothetical protein